MNVYETQLLEQLKRNCSIDSMRRARTDNADIRALSLVRHNCIDWLKIVDRETILDIGADYGDLSSCLSERCRRLLILPCDETHEAIIKQRIRGLKNTETVSREILEDENVRIDRIIVHDIPLRYENKETFFMMVNGLITKGIPKIVLICDCPESWRSHLHRNMKQSEKAFIKSRYAELAMLPEELLEAIDLKGVYEPILFAAAPDNTFPRIIEKKELKKNTGTSFTLLLEREPDLYEGIWRFSNDRAQRYALKTVVAKDGVFKRADSIFSVPFLERMLTTKEKLDKQYNDPHWRCVRCQKDKEALVFAVVKGENLKDILTELLEKKDETAFLRLIGEYVDFVYKSHADGFFSPSRSFREMFGNVKGLEDCRSASYTNIDLTFDNIIVNESQHTVIDYEWTFDFPIPAGYIMFRSIFYLFKYLPDNAYYRRMKRSALDICRIDRIQEKEFMKMEEHFQEAIMGGLKRSFTVNWAL